MTAQLKFFYNGIKENGGKLQKCYYSNGKLLRHPDGTITIYARDYERFSSGVREWFIVQNDTDIATDYFADDVIRVLPNHPLYNEVLKAYEQSKAHNAKTHAKREAKAYANKFMQSLNELTASN